MEKFEPLKSFFSQNDPQGEWSGVNNSLQKHFYKQGFAKHMNGMKHKSRMDAMMGLHIEKSNQLISRIKAEEHLRKIESSPR